MPSTSIAYLAPRGTYSDEAARVFAEKMEARDVEFVALPSFNEVYEAVERGRCEFGVMPIENSLEGAVTATLDAFAFRSGCSIVGSTVVNIHHCLFLNPEATMDDVTTIASHPQGLGQCRRFLNEHFPKLHQVSAKSTADGIRMAAEDKHVAGIGSKFAGGLFDCKMELEGIEDHFGNQTKFVLIARTGHPQAIKGTKMKTSLALFLENDRPGALQMILSEFNYAEVNLTMIQSRPTKQGLGDYMFFIDIEGSQDDLAVRTALDCLRLKLREVKILGSYPTE